MLVISIRNYELFSQPMQNEHKTTAD